MTQQPNHNLSWALHWASQGWKLFPSYWGTPPGKDKPTHMPLLSWGALSSNDPEIIKSWVAQWPECYFCVAIKQSGLTLLDIDVKHGRDGRGELNSLELIHGPLPDTLKATTPSGGLHYWFSGNCQNTIGKIAPGIDTPVMAPVPGTLVPGKGVYLIKED